MIHVKSVIRLSCVSVALLAVPGLALAGERTGIWGDTPLAGASICQFSGLNDDPTGIDPADHGPPGRTQSFGQNIAKWGADPRDPVEQPGTLCNPNNLPWKPIGR